MPGHQHISDNDPHDKPKIIQEKANADLPTTRLDNQHSSISSQDKANNIIVHHVDHGAKGYSIYLAGILWITCIAFLLVYLYIDICVLYKDHLLVRDLPSLQQRGLIYYMSRFMHLFTYTFLAFSMVWIMFKAHKTRAMLYFVLVIELLVLSGIANQLYVLGFFDGYLYFQSALALAFGLPLIKLVQEFPLHLSRQNIIRAATHKRFRYGLIGPLVWLLKIKNQLLSLLPLFLVIAWLLPGLSYEVRTWIILVGCVSVSIGYVLVQIDGSSHKKLQPLYWWLWSLLITALFYLYMVAAQLLQLNLPIEIWQIFFTISLASIIVCCLMTVYFTDLLDAALVLRKTLLYGSLLFILLTLFGSMEHFGVDRLADWLNVNNTLISSVFAGLTGMLFHPLKQKLSHWMKRFENSQVIIRAEPQN